MSAPQPVAADTRPTTKPSLLALARAWVAIGSQSLGGGPSTLYMMRAVLVEQRRWADASIFRDCWSICQASPGIHQIALAGLLGERVRGLPGMAISVVAFVLPSAFITVLFTAGLVEVEQFPLVQGLLRGILPATGGMTLALATFFALAAMRPGRARYFDLLVVAVAAVLVGVAKLPVPLIVLGSACFGAFFLRPRPTTVLADGE